MARTLREGLYEEIVSGETAEALRLLDPQRYSAPLLDEAGSNEALARYLARALERALGGLPKAEVTEAQARMVNALLARLRELTDDEVVRVGEQVEEPPRRLEAVHGPAPRRRPTTPLASSTLLTRSRGEPALGQELALEIGSADSVVALVAFITMPGVRALREALNVLALRGGTLRVLTTTFTGTTEVEAVDALAQLPGAEVRISYDVRRTRLHAKAWLFRRETGLHTAYVGSANLTATALGSGQEWMVKICSADLPHVIEKFEGTFESLWNDGEFVRYDPRSDSDRAHLRAALRREASSDATTVLFELRPLPFQEEILDRLATERAVHGRYRNLVVAATGTGKTVIAAFDYLREKRALGVAPRLLYLAHRAEILDQARTTFRHVLKESDFGEMLGDGAVPERWDHVFATIQSASKRLPTQLAPDHFSYVVVDECHHAPADSYRALVPWLRPKILLGLTATPERTDGKSLLGDFDGRVAAELRLWHAMDRQLLVPFEYFGINDEVDLRQLTWSRTGYLTSQLSNLYTGNEARVVRIRDELARRVSDVRRVRALAFCVSVEHAVFMARALTERGVPAIAVHGDSPPEVRAAVRGQLERREVNVVCTVDLYNEGIDLPFVDVLLLLRPTSSATLFLQQIGRGLRLHEDKASCLVLDFIGQHHRRFRFDRLLTALTGVEPRELRQAVEQGFPYLPSGCVLQLDTDARATVMASLRAAIESRSALVQELRELGADGTEVDLRTFLTDAGRELEDVYSAGSWTRLRRDAGLVADVDDETLATADKLAGLLHVDEPTRLRSLIAIAGTADHVASASTAPLARTRAAMLDVALESRGVLRVAEETVAYVRRTPEVKEELRQLAEALVERVSLPRDEYPVPEWPLALHRHYRRIEIVAAVGLFRPGEKKKIPQGGILKLDDQRRELLFVTLDKSGRSFSPSTRYRDYAISRTTFHWETQGAASVDRASGRRYVESPGNAWSFHLFVRERPGAAYAYLGPATYASHTGNRPIAITWSLAHAIPAMLFEEFATLAQG